jgi:hypothetical protein
MGQQGFATPVLRDESEQAMLDAVPLCALPRRTVEIPEILDPSEFWPRFALAQRAGCPAFIHHAHFLSQ